MSDWSSKIDEAKEAGMQQVALFLTGLNFTQRQECYAALKGAGLSVPLVHATSEMSCSELELLCRDLGAKKFNIHPLNELPLRYDLSFFKDIIYIENVYGLPERDIASFAGICLDKAHQEDNRRRNPNLYQHINTMLKRYPVGFCHISAVGDVLITNEHGEKCYDSHLGESFADFDYLLLDNDYLKYDCALELVNTITWQRTLINYLQSGHQVP